MTHTNSNPVLARAILVWQGSGPIWAGLRFVVGDNRVGNLYLRLCIDIEIYISILRVGFDTRAKLLKRFLAFANTCGFVV